LQSTHSHRSRIKPQPTSSGMYLTVLHAQAGNGSPRMSAEQGTSGDVCPALVSMLFMVLLLGQTPLSFVVPFFARLTLTELTELTELTVPFFARLTLTELTELTELTVPFFARLTLTELTVPFFALSMPTCFSQPNTPHLQCPLLTSQQMPYTA
jgi:hypothetical protein